jgi:hypothetical protein
VIVSTEGDYQRTVAVAQAAVRLLEQAVASGQLSLASN